ncbi:MAG: hypothetical protein WC346_00295 [Methanogenium sp.]
MSKTLIRREVVKRPVQNLFKAEEVYTPGVGDTLPPYQIYEPSSYRDGPEGFIKWCEENVCIPIYPVGAVMAVWCPIKDLPKDINPKTGKAYSGIWEAQKEVVRQALRMMDGEFIYRLIVLCWMRGEGKSLLAVLIQLWKFFNWSKQQIVLGANSKEQVTFVHFDIMKDIILNSPKLLAGVGKRNIIEKKIRITDEKGNDVSVIRAISSFSGIVSNITGYTFSEIFDMKKPNFFVQLDGSIRNIPNALGVIDSTVSSKTHILYQLFESYTKRTSKSVFFHYRFSKEGKADDYWNPNMDQSQLDDYRTKFPLGEFERYFLNTWSSASQRIFTDEMIMAMQYLGVDGAPINSIETMKACKKIVDLEDSIKTLMEGRQVSRSLSPELGQIMEVKKRMMPLGYDLRDDGGFPIMATLNDLERLGSKLDTKWAILTGLDRADPMKVTNRGARTIFACIAKGLPGSGSRPFLIDEKHVPLYVYVLLHLANIEDHSLESLKEVITSCKNEYDGVDKLCGERWGIWDLVPWCETEGIAFEAVFPTYDKQKAAFSELYLCSSGGRIKAPPVGVWGSKETDILREESKIFFHDPDKHWFGSPEKAERNGIQDDVMFTIAWTIYGGREINANDFRERRSDHYFGTMVRDMFVTGNY